MLIPHRSTVNSQELGDLVMILNMFCVPPFCSPFYHVLPITTPRLPTDPVGRGLGRCKLDIEVSSIQHACNFLCDKIPMFPAVDTMCGSGELTCADEISVSGCLDDKPSIFQRLRFVLINCIPMVANLIPCVKVALGKQKLTTPLRNYPQLDDFFSLGNHYDSSNPDYKTICRGFSQ